MTRVWIQATEAATKKGVFQKSMGSEEAFSFQIISKCRAAVTAYDKRVSLLHTSGPRVGSAQI